MTTETKILKATTAAIVSVLERLWNALDSGDFMAALDEAMTLDQGAMLLTAALAIENDISPEMLNDLRADLVRRIEESGQTDVDITVTEFPKSFFDQRKNAQDN